MSTLLDEPLVRRGRHNADDGVDFGPTYLHQLRGGMGPRPVCRNEICMQKSGVAPVKTRFQAAMDRGRSSANNRRRNKGIKA